MPRIYSREEANTARRYNTLSPRACIRRTSFSRRQTDSAPWWFIFNHRDSERASDHTYMGLLVVKRMREPQLKPLQLFRNIGWREPKEEFSAQYDQDLLGQFPTLHQKEQEGAFRKAFGRWHAALNTELSSWDHREYWPSMYDARTFPKANRPDVRTARRCFEEIDRRREEIGERRRYSGLFYQARLIQFQVTPKTDSHHPVVWSIRLGSQQNPIVDAFFISTFSPLGNAFSNKYCVEIGN